MWYIGYSRGGSPATVPGSGAWGAGREEKGVLALNIDCSLEWCGRKEGEMMVENQLFKRLVFLMSRRAWVGLFAG